MLEHLGWLKVRVVLNVGAGKRLRVKRGGAKIRARMKVLGRARAGVKLRVVVHVRERSTVTLP